MSGLVQFRTEDLGPQHRLVQVELAVQLLDDLRRGLEVDDRVDALGLLVDLIGETTTAPGVDLLHTAAAIADDGQEGLDQRGDSALLKIGVENEHQLVVTHSGTHLLWTQRPRHFRGRRVCICVSTLTRTTNSRGTSGGPPGLAQRRHRFIRYRLPAWIPRVEIRPLMPPI